MRRKFNKGILEAAVMVFLIAFSNISIVSAKGGATSNGNNAAFLTLQDKIRHEIVMLPYLGVFDDVVFTIKDSNTVILDGYVVRAMLKSEVETAVRQVPGVAKVVNEIEVLPLSRFDASLREKAYRAIYLNTGFEKYAIQVNPPIRIIVKNGNITLEGVVDSSLDKNLADMAAKSVSGAFSVKDNLVIG